jgi:hypothetical protein
MPDLGDFAFNLRKHLHLVTTQVNDTHKILGDQTQPRAMLEHGDPVKLLVCLRKPFKCTMLVGPHDSFHRVEGFTASDSFEFTKR